MQFCKAVKKSLDVCSRKGGLLQNRLLYKPKLPVGKTSRDGIGGTGIMYSKKTHSITAVMTAIFIFSRC